MPRKPLNLDYNTLQNTIDIIEASGGLANQSLLWRMVADKLNISSSAVQQYFRKLKCQCKTQKGKPGCGLRGTKRPKKSKKHLYKTPEGHKHLEILKQITPERFQSKINKIARGSLKAAIDVKCLDCSGNQIDEVRNCTVTDCALYLIRPYQVKEDKNESKQGQIQIPTS